MAKFSDTPSKRLSFSFVTPEGIVAFFRELHSAKILEPVPFAIFREGNVIFFADAVADCYRYMLVCMKKNMVEKYKFRSVATIRIPEKY